MLWWKTVVRNVCLAPDSEESEASKEVVTTICNNGQLAITSYQKRDFVVFYRGTRVTREQFFEIKREKEIVHEYIFTDDKIDLHIDPTDVALETTAIARYADDD